MNCTTEEIMLHIEENPKLSKAVDALCVSYLEITLNVYARDEFYPILEASFCRNMSAYTREEIERAKKTGKNIGTISVGAMMEEVFRRVSDDVFKDAQLKGELLLTLLSTLAKNADTWEQFTDEVVHWVEMGQLII